MNDVGMGIFAFLIELAGIHELSEFLSSLEGMEQAAKDAFSVVGVFICIFGLLQCFLGYKLFKFWCSVIGLIFGCFVGLIIVSSGLFSGSTGINFVGILLVILLAITGSLLAYRAYIVGLFIYAFGAAFSIAFSLLAFVTDSIPVGLIAGVIAGITLGIIAVRHSRFWIITATAVSGGLSVCVGIMLIMQTTNIHWGFLLPPILIITGFIVQNTSVNKSIGRHKGSTATEVPPVYPTAPPPIYPPQPVNSNIPQVDPTAETEPLPPITPQTGTTPHTSQTPDYYTD